MSHKLVSLLVCVLLVLGSVLAVPAHAASYTVTPASAARFNWSQLRAGDVVTLGAGTYRTSIRLNVRGTPAAPITIRAQGRVVFFGGRSTPLPYCGQGSYRQQSALRHAFEIGSAQHVIIDGAAMRGITIHGYNGSGVVVGSGASHVTLRNLHIYDNGEVLKSGGGYEPDRWGKSEGILIEGASHVTVERAIIHDNAADAIQTKQLGPGFVLRQSWLYNSRTAPNGDTFNRCTHQDGIQFLDGASDVLIEDSVIGPRFLQGIIAGHAPTQNITIRHTLFQDTDNTHISNQDSGARDWTIENITTRGSIKGRSITLLGSGHTISGANLDQGVNGSVRVSMGAGARITSPEALFGALPDLPPLPTTPNDAGGFDLLAYMPPWIRLALGGLLGSDDPIAPPTDSIPMLPDLPTDELQRRIVSAALSARGKPYRWGATGPDAFDCSGLVQWAYARAGIRLSRVVSTQARDGRPVPCTLADLNGAQTRCWQPGDLIQLDYPPSMGSLTRGDHTALYVGDGLFLDCLNSGTGCIHHAVEDNPYYRQYFWQVRRILP